MALAAYSSVIKRPSKIHTATLVFLHGLGDNGHGWSEILWPLLPPYCRLVCPHAPVRPLTVYGGEQIPAWFDVLARSPSSAVQDPSSVAEAVSSLNRLLAAEVAALPSTGRLLLGGFSQGGALALYAGLAGGLSCRLAGLVGLSCYLPLMEQADGKTECGVASGSGQSQPPVFLAHGDADEVVLPERSRTAGQLMREKLGVTDLRYHVYPGLEHCNGNQEMADLKDFIWSVLSEKQP
ncbi:hypothetical protein BOX15_Mlig001722g1 [Macrostomum lignano]|uniref:palmitoyl-protein hydrolase n=1 Tax=Macrostomum lignano TaxID=282301 RepID=A0A267EJS6_9PLAT|nr:hypothetical protein BOX15_Mlig001722g1 [Macrostomum lignano]